MKVSLEDLIGEIGPNKVRNLLMPTYDVFLEQVEEAVHQALDHIESEAKTLAPLGEDGLTASVVGFVTREFLFATREANSRGHVDVTIQDRERRFKWKGEAKIDRGYKYLVEGLYQVLGYEGGRHKNVGLITYYRRQNAVNRLKRFVKKLEKTKAHGFVEFEEIAEARSFLTARSKHVHPSTGADIRILHMGASMYIEDSPPGGPDADEEPDPDLDG